MTSRPEPEQIQMDNECSSAYHEGSETRTSQNEEKEGPMKVSITITVDLRDPQQWATAFGTGTSAAEIRADVKSYIGNTIQAGPPFDGEVNAEITWR